MSRPTSAMGATRSTATALSPRFAMRAAQWQRQRLNASPLSSPGHAAEKGDRSVRPAAGSGPRGRIVQKDVALLHIAHADMNDGKQDAAAPLRVRRSVPRGETEVIR